ncbi:hypothetical protein NITLEN_10169 [Nitrospira lenta]|uniref:Cation-transporting P-type ATPase N-terminal domain-containing protein n=1 Tax=Nitrospira lenta TaxID=1436998 RepID=A0A330L1J0_9BACT|nr:hypothetical protein NITLEN_10169 [Nitrospira lenta]
MTRYWHTLAGPAVAAELHVDQQVWLSVEEVSRRHADYGFNKLPEAA